MLPQPCLRLQCDLILFLTMTHTCYRSCRGHGSSRAKSAAKSQSWVGADREQEKRAYGVPAACQPQLSRWMSRVRRPRHPVWRHRVLPLQRWRRRSHFRKKWVGEREWGLENHVASDPEPSPCAGALMAFCSLPEKWKPCPG